LAPPFPDPSAEVSGATMTTALTTALAGWRIPFTPRWQGRTRTRTTNHDKAWYRDHDIIFIEPSNLRYEDWSGPTIAAFDAIRLQIGKYDNA
jgi:hypothetical protein